MTAGLNFTETTDGLVFDVGGGAVPVDRWATLDVEAQANVRAQIGTLLRLRDQGDAEECGTNQLLVEHRAVAGLTGREARGLALPPRFDFQLRLPSEKFTVAEPEFRYRYQVIDRGRPLRFEAPRGCLMRVDGRDRLLPLPIFELITRMEAFNRTPPKRMDDRLRAWGELSKRLPDEVEVDPYLRSIRVVVPESFTLRPFVNPGGEPDFDPELLVHRSDNEQQDKMLPDARDEDFRAQFRGRRRVKGQYAAGEGWYVCVSEPMKLALEVVHDLQRAPVEVRRAALLNPRGFLADRLSDRVDALTLEAIFDDRGLGDRVMGIGLWEPKVMPWIDRPTQEWLPPEAVGLRVDDESLEIPKEQLEELRDRVVAGIAAGAPSVLLGDHSVPATHETVAALDVLIERTSRSEATGSDSREQPPDDEAPGRVVLLVKDHVTEASFEPEHLTRAGDVAAPSLLRSSLYPHQQVALEWLIGHWKRGSSGALLADDMGLGKTIESLAFIAWVREQMLSGLHPLRPVLVVAPSGLLQNWRDEAETHLEPEALGRLLPAYGPELRSLRDSKLRELQVGAPVLDLGRLERSDWTLTTYETLRDYQHSFGRVHWSVIVFDETQKIKNPRTAMTDAAKAQRADFLAVSKVVKLDRGPWTAWIASNVQRRLPTGPGDWRGGIASRATGASGQRSHAAQTQGGSPSQPPGLHSPAHDSRDAVGTGWQIRSDRCRSPRRAGGVARCSSQGAAEARVDFAAPMARRSCRRAGRRRRVRGRFGSRGGPHPAARRSRGTSRKGARVRRSKMDAGPTHPALAAALQPRPTAAGDQRLDLGEEAHSTSE